MHFAWLSFSNLNCLRRVNQMRWLYDFLLCVLIWVTVSWYTLAEDLVLSLELAVRLVNKGRSFAKCNNKHSCQSLYLQDLNWGQWVTSFFCYLKKKKKKAKLSKTGQAFNFQFCRYSVMKPGLHPLPGSSKLCKRQEGTELHSNQNITMHHAHWF